MCEEFVEDHRIDESSSAASERNREAMVPGAGRGRVRRGDGENGWKPDAGAEAKEDMREEELIVLCADWCVSVTAIWSRLTGKADKGTECRDSAGDHSNGGVLDPCEYWSGAQCEGHLHGRDPCNLLVVAARYVVGKVIPLQLGSSNDCVEMPSASARARHQGIQPRTH